MGYRIRDGGYICPETSPRLSDRRFREMFGCSSTVCANAWLLIMDGWNDKPSAATKDRFLWALSLLKSYDTEGNLSCNAGEGCDEKAFRHWAWFFLEELSQNHVEIVCIFMKCSSVVSSSSLLLFFIVIKKKDEKKLIILGCPFLSFFLLFFHC